MSFGAKAEQRTYIIVCVELGKSPMKTKQLQEKTQSVSSVSRALVYRFSEGFQKIPRPTKLKNDWKTYCNHGKFDIECVEFTTTLHSPDCERYCTYVYESGFRSIKCILLHGVYIEKE